MRIRRWFAIGAVVALVGLPVGAQSTGGQAGQADGAADPGAHETRLAARFGATIDPDQFHLGLHVRLAELAPRFQIRPSLEIGFGSGQSTLLANIDGLYAVHGTRTTLILVGGGVGMGTRWGDEIDSGGIYGASLVGALEWGARAVPHVSGARGSQLRYLLELRIGLGDLPGLKATVGLQF
jgi:hypothetical protein